jgi:transcriptional antiterminator RfaH
VNKLFWFVAHTKPRCEKKFARHCAQEKLEATMPCYKAVHRYRGKTVVFEKPLFPGYVFLRITAEQKSHAYQCDHLANLLAVPDQELFGRQLADVLLALDSKVEVKLASDIGEGMRVKIKSGPLRGLDGWVEQRHGPDTVILRIDFIGKAVAVKLDALDLEQI